jgi:hypothetical protein
MQSEACLYFIPGRVWNATTLVQDEKAPFKHLLSFVSAQ